MNINPRDYPISVNRGPIVNGLHSLNEQSRNVAAESSSRNRRIDADRLIASALAHLRANADVHHASSVEAVVSIGILAGIAQGSRNRGEYAAYILDLFADVRSALSPLARQSAA